jgi:hypothetical protein
MQVASEIKLGTRKVLEHLFSPVVTKAFHEVGRERQDVRMSFKMRVVINKKV